MAEEPENRMLFDLRGRRKRVIQVIYVILAFIMAASLVVIGLPGGINPFGNSTSVNQDAAEANLERAEKLQTRSQQQPANENVSKELIRARINAGNSLVEIDQTTGAQTVTEEAQQQYQLAAESWDRYVRRSNGDPDPAVAQLVANTLFTLAQGSTVAQFESNIQDAASAQQFYADNAVKEQKNGGVNAAGPLTQLATFQLYAQQYDKAAQTRKQAIAATPDKAEQEEIRQTLDATEKDAKRVGKLITKAKKQARKSGGESLENPLGSLGSDTSVGGTTTP
ncbi:MAG: hypothetical protein KDB48_05485 [Solirubrobacterales bacterium]|nr:hypothetical protein [Solirubrobacterales bacterium]HMT04342.1 hypothetical protein [Solirubrobacterales bacterium]